MTRSVRRALRPRRATRFDRFDSNASGQCRTLRCAFHRGIPASCCTHTPRDAARQEEGEETRRGWRWKRRKKTTTVSREKQRRPGGGVRCMPGRVWRRGHAFHLSAPPPHDTAANTFKLDVHVACSSAPVLPTHEGGDGRIGPQKRAVRRESLQAERSRGASSPRRGHVGGHVPPHDTAAMAAVWHGPLDGPGAARGLGLPRLARACHSGYELFINSVGEMSSPASSTQQHTSALLLFSASSRSASPEKKKRKKDTFFEMLNYFFIFFLNGRLFCFAGKGGLTACVAHPSGLSA